MFLKLNSRLIVPVFMLFLTIFILWGLDSEKAAAASGNWSGQIFPKNNLEGTPIIVEQIDDLNLNWGDILSPAPGIPANTAFSAIYERKVTVEEGAYNLLVNANGGTRVYVDGKLEIDRWTDTGKLQNFQQPLKLSAGTHTIRVEFNETAGEASISFKLDDLLRDNRWFGVVYPSTDMKGKGILVGGSPQIPELNFNWGDVLSPAQGIPANTAFSAIYQRKVTVEEGAYNLLINANGGIRVYVDGKLEIDRWSDTGKLQNFQQPLKLSEGTHTIRVEFNETAGEASVSFKLDDLLRDNRWFGVVYPSTDLKGKGILVGGSPQLPELNFNWGDVLSPAPGIPANTAFSAVYQRRVTVEEGAYNLLVNANGGIRVYVDGKLEIDRWSDTGKLQNFQQPLKLSEGTHTIRVEFNETAGEASVSFKLDDLLRDNRWFGVVYPSTDLKGKGILVGGSPQIPELEFNWGDVLSPAPGIPANTAFSAIYQRNFDVQSGTYKLIVNLNGGVRVYVDGKLEIERWSDTGKDEVLTQNVYLTAGKHSIRVEYNEFTGIAKIGFDLVPAIGKITEYITSYYPYTFQNMLEKQMSVKPQTDKKYNTFIRSDGLIGVSNGYGYINGDGWNVRGGPGTNYWIVGSINNNEKVAIYNQVKASDGWDWFQIQYNKTWVNASPEDVSYYVNSNNFSRTDAAYYQFLQLSTSAGLNVTEANEKLLKDKGTLTGKAQAFIDSGRKYGVNEVYLISHALLETGNGKSVLANGVIVNGVKVYNMYGIAAYDSCAVDCAAKYAYDKGWTTPELAIEGGAQWIAANYVGIGQDTLYKMRWNPERPATHQYASDIGWAVKQTTQISRMYGMLDDYIQVFDVPKYQNQPSFSKLSSSTASISQVTVLDKPEKTVTISEENSVQEITEEEKEEFKTEESINSQESSLPVDESKELPVNGQEIEDDLSQEIKIELDTSDSTTEFEDVQENQVVTESEDALETEEGKSPDTDTIAIENSDTEK